MTIYVDCNVKHSGNGTKEYPFKKISEAANIALPGDEVLVEKGIYREYVNPKNAGTKENRITYRSKEIGGAIISGAEQITQWTKCEGGVYCAHIPNGIFSEYNPYTTLVRGDWFIAYFKAHTGEVYLNGKSMYEVNSLEEVKNPKIYAPSWDRDWTTHVWYTEQNQQNDETVIYANFQGADPNKECVEINVRKTCFYPSEEGRGYITLSGFCIKQAATQWAPPTAYQEGMVGPHWSKGWIIEDCEISDSKCSGISLGKYLQPNNDNKWLTFKYKDGTQTERDNICQAQIEGWTKENIGSHIVRRCNIHDCGQTGIVGHLGGVFSIIEDNHIHHINNKQNLAGAEIGGIKMHAAIDVIYRRNHIHHCTRGLWLDWQAQGTRVTQNFFHDNTLPNDYNVNKEGAMGLGEDIFVEVSHGPTLIDNNLLLSDHALKLATQGVALVHNLIAGSITCVGLGVNNGSISKPSPRFTPYHVPHRTEIMGFMTILHGDVRFYNNIFIQKNIRAGMKEIMDATTEAQKNGNDWGDNNIYVGTHPYDSYPTAEEWKAQFEGYCGMGSEASDRYYNPLPVWSEGNAFFNGARSMKKDKNAFVDNEHKITLTIEEKNGKYTLCTNVYEFLPDNKNAKSALKTICTKTLGLAFESEEQFENPDATEIVFNEDYFGKHRAVTPTVGPFEGIDKAQIEL